MTTAKIKPREELQTLLISLKAEGKKIGYTSGVFDLLHAGHVQYLEDAKKLCDLLVVGINSDASVRRYKDIHRPIIAEDARAFVVSGLQSVDFVFIFNEVNNNQNVTLLKPDIYIKAGDYPLDKLSSKPLVEAYGGSVATVQIKQGYSSSQIIKTISQAFGEQHGAALPLQYEKRPALFVDRDGTIIEHIEYLHDPNKVRFLPGAMEALKEGADKGYRIVLVTNQPGIGLGYFTKEDLFRVNKEILKRASVEGLLIDKIYYCPHSKSDNCPCRKPATSLALRAKNELNIDLEKSFVIGDMTSDIQFGKNAGCKTILVKTGAGGGDGLYAVRADYEVNDLTEIAAIVPEAEKAPHLSDDKPLILYEGELQTVGYVTGKLGHDFNNLIGTLLGGMDLIKSKSRKMIEGENPFERPLALMSTAVHKAVDLTSRIRSYARPSPMDLGPVSVKTLLADAVQQFQKINGMDLPITIEPFEEFVVQGNLFFLTRIIVSLLENSLQATRKDFSNAVTISVFLNPKSKKAQISIKDKGKGIPPESLNRIFTPFVTKKSGIGVGYGLSLAMAKINLSKMQGAIIVTSKPEEGAEVLIELVIA